VPRRAPRLTTTALIGAAILLAVTLTRLPSFFALLYPPLTPFDRAHPRIVPAFALLTEARAVLPAGASVTVLSEPPDAVSDTDMHHLAVALLPGRRVLPAAFRGMPRPDLARLAEFVVVVGQAPPAPPGDVLLKRAEGTVWRRRPS
jgi:hypothetical protein